MRPGALCDSRTAQRCCDVPFPGEKYCSGGWPGALALAMRSSTVRKGLFPADECVRREIDLVDKADIPNRIEAQVAIQGPIDWSGA